MKDRGLSRATYARLFVQFLMLSMLHIFRRMLITAGILSTLILVYWSYRPHGEKVFLYVLVSLAAVFYLIYCGMRGLPSFTALRQKIAGMTKDPDLLVELAKRDRSVCVRAEAVKWLTNQALLEEIAHNDDSIAVRSAAASSLTSPETLLNILVESRNVQMWRQCSAAIIKAIKADESFQRDVGDAVRQTEFAEELLRLPICKHCFGLVEHRKWQEWKSNCVDPFTYTNNGEDAPELVSCQNYFCSTCRTESPYSFSVPFASFLDK